jgi:hypothetical protein
MTAGLRRMHALWRRHGVRQRLLRRILSLQCCLCAGCALSALALAATARFAPPPGWRLDAAHALAWLSAGTLLALWNFFSLTKLVREFMVIRYNLVTGFLFICRSQARLLVTAGVVILAIVLAAAPPWAILAGFSLSPLSVLICALSDGGSKGRKRQHHAAREGRRHPYGGRGRT